MASDPRLCWEHGLRAELGRLASWHDLRAAKDDGRGASLVAVLKGTGDESGVALLIVFLKRLLVGLKSSGDVTAVAGGGVITPISLPTVAVSRSMIAKRGRGV